MHNFHFRSNNSLLLKAQENMTRKLFSLPVKQYHILYQNQDSINLLYGDTKTKMSYLKQNINKLPRPKKVPKEYNIRFDNLNHLKNLSASQIGSYIWLTGIRNSSQSQTNIF